jgi:predicted esterase
MRLLTGFIVASLIVAAIPAAADWSEDLDRLLVSSPGPARDALVERVAREAPGWAEVARRLESITFPDAPEAGTAVLRTTVCADSVGRPWVLVVPEGYDSAVPTPALMVLHGGVSRQDVIEDPLAFAGEDAFVALARARGWFAIVPFGQEGATWWDDVGMANIDHLLRVVKAEYNIDDDRVWMIGFSDGASAGFGYAMLDPTDYGAFVALNGHMGVASIDGGRATYAPNMAATPIYAVTTFDDALYPSARMRPAIEMARAAGADIFYRELPGTHDFPYAHDELPAIARFLERHPRDPFPSRIVWETGGGDFGRCDWFAIDRVGSGEPAPWYADHNVSLADETVTIGFHVDDTYEGGGVRVRSVVDDDYPARRMGLREGDIIVSGNGEVIADEDDLWTFKSHVRRGGVMELGILRSGEPVTLRASIPAEQYYFVFKREVPSAKAIVSFAANRIDIEASRVGALRVLVHPDMVDLDRNLTISVDGDVVYHQRVDPDVRFMISDFLENRDRSLIYVAEIPLSLE